ncbi:hypothetical protein ACJX0J_006648, partial [Zea mays]
LHFDEPSVQCFEFAVKTFYNPNWEVQLGTSNKANHKKQIYPYYFQNIQQTAEKFKNVILVQSDLIELQKAFHILPHITFCPLLCGFVIKSTHYTFELLNLVLFVFQYICNEIYSWSKINLIFSVKLKTLHKNRLALHKYSKLLLQQSQFGNQILTACWKQVAADVTIWLGFTQFIRANKICDTKEGIQDWTHILTLKCLLRI